MRMRVGPPAKLSSPPGLLPLPRPLRPAWEGMFPCTCPCTCPCHPPAPDLSLPLVDLILIPLIPGTRRGRAGRTSHRGRKHDTAKHTRECWCCRRHLFFHLATCIWPSLFNSLYMYVDRPELASRCLGCSPSDLQSLPPSLV